MILSCATHSLASSLFLKTLPRDVVLLERDMCTERKKVINVVWSNGNHPRREGRQAKKEEFQNGGAICSCHARQKKRMPQQLVLSFPRFLAPSLAGLLLYSRDASPRERCAQLPRSLCGLPLGLFPSFCLRLGDSSNFFPCSSRNWYHLFTQTPPRTFLAAFPRVDLHRSS